jgi:hypothetical protein
MREFLWDDNATIAKEHEGGEYPPIICLVATHPHLPTLEKGQEKLDANR